MERKELRGRMKRHVHGMLQLIGFPIDYFEPRVALSLATMAMQL